MDTSNKSTTQPIFGLNDTQQMMYAFGDSRRPNIETAKLGKIDNFMEKYECLSFFS